MYGSYQTFDSVVVFKSYLIRHSVCLAYRPQSLDPKAFGKGESTGKTAGQNQPDIQTQRLPEVADGSPKQRHSQDNASWFEMLTRNNLNTQSWTQTHLNFSN